MYIYIFVGIFVDISVYFHTARLVLQQRPIRKNRGRGFRGRRLKPGLMLRVVARNIFTTGGGSMSSRGSVFLITGEYSWDIMGDITNLRK